MRYKSCSNLHEGFHRSVVDLELPGRAADIELLKAEYGSELSVLGATVVEAGKPAAFRIDVPLAKPPEFDATATRGALEAWTKLLTWWEKGSRDAQVPRQA